MVRGLNDDDLEAVVRRIYKIRGECRESEKFLKDALSNLKVGLNFCGGGVLAKGLEISANSIGYENFSNLLHEASIVWFCVGGFFTLAGLIGSSVSYLECERLRKDEKEAEEDYRFLENCLKISENDSFGWDYCFRRRANIFR